jgi:DNA-binding IclR family transcriptional regulator
MNDTVKSAERVFDILEVFALWREPLALKDVAGQLGIPKSSALMLLRTLESRGYLMRDGERYVLDPVWQSDAADGGCFIGGHTMRLIRIAEPVMRDLVDRLEETIVLGVPTLDGDVRVVANRMSPLTVRYDQSRISVIPGYCTALGQAMLAFQDQDAIDAYVARCPFKPLTDHTITSPEAFRSRLAEIRQRGWAVNQEERFLGAVGLASPILGQGGSVLGALNIGTVPVRYRRRRTTLVAALQRAVATVTEQLDTRIPQRTGAAATR